MKHLIGITIFDALIVFLWLFTYTTHGFEPTVVAELAVVICCLALISARQR